MGGGDQLGLPRRQFLRGHWPAFPLRRGQVRRASLGTPDDPPGWSAALNKGVGYGWQMSALVQCEDAFELAVIAAIEGRTYAQILNDRRKQREARARKAARLATVQHIAIQAPSEPQPRAVKPEPRSDREQFAKSWRNMVALAEHFAKIKPTKTSVILFEVARKYGVTVDYLKSPAMTYDVIVPRFEAMWRLRRETPLSLNQIGTLFRRDHSSVVNAERKYAAWQRAKAGLEPPPPQYDISKIIPGDFK
jgi:hypothetical protein